MGARLVLDAAEVEEGGGGGGTFLKQFDCESDCTFFSSSNSEGKSKDYHASEEAAARTRDAEARRRNLPRALLNFPAESEATAAEVAGPSFAAAALQQQQQQRTQQQQKEQQRKRQRAPSPSPPPRSPRESPPPPPAPGHGTSGGGGAPLPVP